MVDQINEDFEAGHIKPAMFCRAQEECRKLMKSNMENKCRLPAEAWAEALKMRRDERKTYRSSAKGQNEILKLVPKLQGPSGVSIKDHQYKNETYASCFTALDCVNWLIKNNQATNEKRAIHLVQNLLNL